MAATGYVLERLSELREEAYCKVLRCFLASQQYDLVSTNTPTASALQDGVPLLIVTAVHIAGLVRLKIPLPLLCSTAFLSSLRPLLASKGI